MRNLRAPSVIVAVCVAVTLAGCAGTQSGSSYSAHQARGELLVRIGVVDSVRQVTIEGEKSPVGVLTGGVVGGIVGSNIGGGNRGSAVGSILGAVAGGAGGNAL